MLNVVLVVNLTCSNCWQRLLLENINSFPANFFFFGNYFSRPIVNHYKPCFYHFMGSFNFYPTFFARILFP